MRGFFITLVPILVLVLLTFAVKLFLFDTLYGLFFVGALLVSLLILNWYIKSADLRWIDIACPSPGPFDPHFFYPDAYGDVHPRSDAELLEWQIADRQRRLSAMGEPMQ